MNTPNRFALLPVMTGMLALAGSGLAQAQEEQARVISATPVVQQVAVPRQVCQEQAVTVPGQKSGAGALIGGIAGGAMGNAVGNGGGRALATMIGLVGGAIVGDRVEGGGQPQTRLVQQCATQNIYENRTVAWNVVYEYAGRQYSTQMAQDPGKYVRVNVTPADAAPPPVQYTPPPVQYVPVQPRVEYVPSGSPVTRIEVGTSFVPAPRVVYVGGFPGPHFVGDHRRWHDRDDDRWIRH